jgi:hypothetical protein
MESVVKKISEAEFINSNYPILFSDKKTDRVFGFIVGGKSNYKFGWQSETLKPFISFLENNVCLIAVDLKFVILDVNNDNVILNLSLDYFFYDAKIYDDFIYVITELEVIIISIKNFNIIKKYALPNFFEKIEFKDGTTEIKCVGNESVIIK